MPEGPKRIKSIVQGSVVTTPLPPSRGATTTPLPPSRGITTTRMPHFPWPITGIRPPQPQQPQRPSFRWPIVGWQAAITGRMGDHRPYGQHEGVDLAPVGASRERSALVAPVAEGVVERVGYQASGYGNFVVIRHPSGYRSLYGHLERVNVRQGQTVTPEAIIGVVGSTGLSTGRHLHLSIIDPSGRYVDPLSVLGNYAPRGSRYEYRPPQAVAVTPTPYPLPPRGQRDTGPRHGRDASRRFGAAYGLDDPRRAGDFIYYPWPGQWPYYYTPEGEPKTNPWEQFFQGLLAFFQQLLGQAGVTVANLLFVIIFLIIFILTLNAIVQKVAGSEMGQAAQKTAVDVGQIIALAKGLV